MATKKTAKKTTKKPIQEFPRTVVETRTVLRFQVSETDYWLVEPDPELRDSSLDPAWRDRAMDTLVVTAPCGSETEFEKKDLIAFAKAIVEFYEGSKEDATNE